MPAGELTRAQGRGLASTSLRHLCRRGELGLEKTRASRALAIYALAERHPSLRSCQHLRPTHLRPLFGLPHAEQARLLATAERERWSTRRIEQEARASRAAAAAPPPLNGTETTARRA